MGAPQRILTPEGGELIVLTREEYDRLVDLADEARDRAVIEARKDEPTMPHELVMAMLTEGLHPLAAWRRTRGLSQSALAAAAGVRKATVADIERGKSRGRADVLRRLADALGLEVDDLIPIRREPDAEGAPG